MTSIPKNNLRELMLKLGYDPTLIKIVPPVLDNSKVVKQESKNQPPGNIKQPDILNLDEWSDFDDD